MPIITQSAADRHWYIVGRWQEFQGESRANLLRILAIGVFYGLQLAQFHFFSEPEHRDVRFHHAASALAALGVLVSMAVQLCLRRRIFPAILKYASTAADIVLISGLAMQGGGPESPLRLAYFVVIALSALRFSLPLIWLASLGTMAGYLTLVGAADKSWFDAEHSVPPIEQLMMLASLALTSVVVGQVVRRVRAVAEDFSRRRTAALQTEGCR